jgi:beta-lactamase regulating signal transducer with metallopeptidase domain
MFLKELFSIVPVNQIGAGLIHFIWQASVIAIVTTLLMILFRNSSSQTRYIICYLSLLSMIILPCTTVYFDVRGPINTFLIVQDEVLSPVQVKDITWGGKFIGTQYRRSEILAASKSNVFFYINTYLPHVTLTWLIGVILLSLYHGFGFFRMQKSVRRTQQVMHPFRKTRIECLLARLGLKQKIQIYLLPSLEIPVVFGCLKPILLIPVSFFTGMDDKYIEAIILHELAHIKRYDYLLNMLQMIIEILGFFHPAVWWLSGRIRAERENCCDDIVVKTMGDKFIYVKSLVQLEELRYNRSVMVAANGGKLHRRVSRILDYKPSSHSSSLLNAAGMIVAIVCIVFLMGFTWSNDRNGWGEGQTQKESERIVRNLSHNLIAYYPFHGNANDESGFQQHGVIRNNAVLTEDRFGRKESAFDFNGKGSHIIAKAVDDTSKSVTVSCWIYPRCCSKYVSWVSNMKATGSWTSQWRAGFGEDKNNEWGFTECRWDSARDFWTDYWAMQSVIPLQRWTHVTAVANYENHMVCLYINGMRIVQIENLKPLEKSSTYYLIGYQNDDKVFFNGKIDDVRIYNRALDSREVFALYNIN